LFKLRAVTVKLTGMRLLSASDHEILREPTPFSATPFSVTVTSPGALGGPTHSNQYGIGILQWQLTDHRTQQE
jgi:hypothetical protein